MATQCGVVEGIRGRKNDLCRVPLKICYEVVQRLFSRSTKHDDSSKVEMIDSSSNYFCVYNLPQIHTLILFCTVPSSV